MNIKISNLRFGKYANKNTAITSENFSITSNILLKLKSDDLVAIRDSKYLIDELISSKIIKEEYLQEIIEGEDKILIYQLTDKCINHK